MISREYCILCVKKTEKILILAPLFVKNAEIAALKKVFKGRKLYYLIEDELE